MGTKTDKSVFAVTGTTLLTFLIANRIGTIWILYPNVLLAVSLLLYHIWQTDEDASLLSSSSIFGLATVLTYAPIDWLFFRKAHLIFYLRSDFFVNTTTPIAIILNWVVFVTLAAYFYQRLVAIFQTRFASDAESPTGRFDRAFDVSGGCHGHRCCGWKCRDLRTWYGHICGNGMQYRVGSDTSDRIRAGFCTDRFSDYLFVVSVLLWSR